MRKIYIANANFEWECEQESTPDLTQSLHLHPLFLQLQFLPLIYAEKNALIAVTQIPPGSDPERFFRFSDKSTDPLTVETFAPSQSVAQWAERQGFHYKIPSWSLVKRLASKELSFQIGKPPKGSALIYSKEELIDWIKTVAGPKVLKTCFGWAGRGHRFVNESLTPSDLNFCHKEWGKGLPLIAEPWVKRSLDFSSHWEISDHIHFKGVVKARNSERGQYVESVVGPEKALFEEWLPYVQEHLNFVKPLLAQYLNEGFFGAISFDAMVYEWDGMPTLQPIVEINPRMTMGTVALALSKPETLTAMSYESEKEGPLPLQLGEIFFNRNLCVTHKSISL